jgi:hypothetical protein
VQVEAFIIKLFNTVEVWADFKGHLRDLILSMKMHSVQNDDFYAEEIAQAR